MIRIAVIAGTSESADFIGSLPEHFEVTAFAATSYGEEILRGKRCSVRAGRLDREGFSRELEGFDAVADLSHPFAVEVSENVSYVCRVKNIPYFRSGREKVNYDYEKIIYVHSKEEAAEYLQKNARDKNILLTTGVNTLEFYEKTLSDRKHRIFARVLESEESKRKASLSQVNIIYGIPPFSKEDTEELIKNHSIGVLVSKDSGIRGGVKEKMSAACSCGIPVVLIGSPEDADECSFRELTEKIEKAVRG